MSQELKCYLETALSKKVFKLKPVCLLENSSATEQ